MRKRYLAIGAAGFLLFWATAWAGPYSADDRAFAESRYGDALAAYEAALASGREDPELRVRIEKAAVAKNADEFLSLLDREVQKRGDIRITAKQLIAMRSRGDDLTLIDVRTAEEKAVVQAAGARHIALPDLFKHLGEIPTTGTVVLICHSSPRAIIAATALRMAGYNNAYALKGGIMALADLNAKKLPDGFR